MTAESYAGKPQLLMTTVKLMMLGWKQSRRVIDVNAIVVVVVAAAAAASAQEAQC
jgi:hypothetical protein